MEQTIDQQIEAARRGDRAALEELIRAVQDRIYNLAMRMLGHPQDAQDATQEILVKMITHLGDFRGESAFSTWVYRIAINTLLNTHKRQEERQTESFEQLAARIEAGVTWTTGERQPDIDERLLAEEIKIGCTQGMLLCLDRDHRIAYILGELFEVSSQQGAEILEITSQAFRQRLSRARKLLRAFLQQHCGLIDPANPCRCQKQIAPCMASGRLHPDRLLFVQHPVAPFPSVQPDPVMQELRTLDRVAAIYRSHPNYEAPAVFVEAIKRLLASDSFTLFS
jgi:RNA polymerase sigma factor (sigma-70 family)